MGDRKFSILVADGSSRIRDRLSEGLEPEGYGIVGAGSGREAIEVIRRRAVHLVVMDVRLPDYSGLEIYHAIKHIRRAFVPCIFTAFEMTTRSLQEAMNEDAITILPKPVDLPRLVHAVGRSIDRFYSNRRRLPPRLDPQRFRFQ